MPNFTLRNFDEEALDKFLEFSEKEGIKVIYVDSTGGFSDVCKAITFTINNNASSYVIVVHGRANSAGFNFLLDVNAPIHVLDTATACIHLPTNDVNTRSLYDTDSEYYFISNVLSPKRDAYYLELYSKYLSEEQLNKIKVGKDVWLISEELKNILEKKEK